MPLLFKPYSDERISPTEMRITRTTVWPSQETRTKTLPITEEQWAAYQKGDYIQRALGHLTASEREFILTGMNDEEYASLGDDEEDEDPEDDKDV